MHDLGQGVPVANFELFFGFSEELAVAPEKVAQTFPTVIKKPRMEGRAVLIVALRR
jgi:hypothetical protein